VIAIRVSRLAPLAAERAEPLLPVREESVASDLNTSIDNRFADPSTLSAANENAPSQSRS
jgi:hypothetical protein